MILPGTVTNVTAFGAFVDIGVHQDGLVHVSHLANASSRTRPRWCGSAMWCRSRC
jgi:transcriptional accessory protein Tex/SPT6